MIPINKPMIGEEERREVLEVLDENSSLTSPAKDGGKKVQNFEQLLRDYLHVKHAIAVNSGTAALYSSFVALGIKPGDEVILPSFTFVATANAVVAAGGKPVFVDIKKQESDYTIDIPDLKSKFTNKTRVVVPVHLYGNPANLDEISEVLRQSSNGYVNMVEDACQSLGSTYKKQQTGTFGLMGCFSMYASKVVTSGEGGAIVTNSDEIADRLKMIRNHGMVEGYDTRIFGLNLRLPEMSAAVAKAQMLKLPKMLTQRRRNAKLLTELLSDSRTKSTRNVAELVTLPEDKHHIDEKESNWYLYTLAFKRDGIRDNILKKLITEYKIGAAVYYDPPVHKTPFYAEMAPISGTPSANIPTTIATDKHYLQSDSTTGYSTKIKSIENSKIKTNDMKLINTNWASKHVLSLPVHPLLTDQDINYIAASLIEAISSSVS
jgi:dTDP-4-amino-4,6-dideoxygalactose transaminase